MDKIKTIEKSYCSICGLEGKLLYSNLVDKYFNAPGEWSFFTCRDAQCNMIWLNPMPIEEDISIAYKNYYTHSDESEYNVASFTKKIYKKIQLEFISANYGYKHLKSSFWYRLLYLDPDRLEQTKYEVMYLKNVGGKLLDIGCGNGTFLDFMNKLGWETIGIDFDEKAIMNSKIKNLNVKLGSLAEQNFPNDFFDAITLSHVIEHVYQPNELLKECYRILKINGKMVISTPNSASLGHKIFKKNWRGLEVPRHIQVFNFKSLIQTIKLSGFHKADSFTTNRIARYIYNFSGKLKQSNLLKNKVSRFTRIGSRLFSFCEWILIKIKINCGEEVIIIAEK